MLIFLNTLDINPIWALWMRRLRQSSNPQPFSDAAPAPGSLRGDTVAPNRSKFVWFFSIAAVFLFLFGVVVGCAAATRPEAAVAPLPWHLAFFSAGAGPDGAVASFFFPLFRDGACDRLESFSMSSPSASGPEALWRWLPLQSPHLLLQSLVQHQVIQDHQT